MCKDKDCIFQFIVEEQTRREVIKDYVDRHNKLMGGKGYPTPPVELPKNEVVQKIVKKRINYMVKYWSTHTPY